MGISNTRKNKIQYLTKMVWMIENKWGRETSEYAIYWDYDDRLGAKDYNPRRNLIWELVALALGDATNDDYKYFRDLYADYYDEQYEWKSHELSPELTERCRAIEKNEEKKRKAKAEEEADGFVRWINFTINENKV